MIIIACLIAAACMISGFTLILIAVGSRREAWEQQIEDEGQMMALLGLDTNVSFNEVALNDEMDQFLRAINEGRAA